MNWLIRKIKILGFAGRLTRDKCTGYICKSAVHIAVWDPDYFEQAKNQKYLKARQGIKKEA